MDPNIDTLKIYERLKRANVDKQAAKEIAEVFKDVADSSLATKSDIERLKVELQAEIEKLRMEMKMEIERSRVDTIKWVAAMLVAQAAAITALIRLFSH
ncbi:hypothetical protein [Candidatus Magnetobacterium casense]|uniref:hypothetical protein n=1 Tax=Candidatus Magnetobacterium casense TaxID=1455061 RepID=UPI00058B3990|nr:hypothetical protein [Candidatus Magnetobacterium casensis]